MTKEERRNLNLTRYKVYAQYRDSKGFTDYHISKELSIPSTVIYDWRSGNCTPRTERLLKICSFLGMPMEEVFADG